LCICESVQALCFVSMNDNVTLFSVCHTDVHSVIHSAWSEEIFLHIDNAAGRALPQKRFYLARRKGVRLGVGGIMLRQLTKFATWTLLSTCCLSRQVI
jgi:hypothetical protein